MSTEYHRSQFSFFHSLRVRWAEVDMQGIVFNGNYLTYADVGITEYFRALREQYPDAQTADGCDFNAIKTTLEYKAPAHFDQLLEIGIRIGKIGRSSITFLMGIWDGETLMTSGEIVYVHAQQQPRVSTPLPEAFCRAVEAFEQTPPLR